MKNKMMKIAKKIFSQREVTVFLIILLVVAITSIIQPKFLSSNNMRSVALSVSVDGLFAIGLTLALILGGIELSVGSVAAMTCVITGYLALQGINIWVACAASIISGLFVGLFNGFMISKIGLPPFIVTLGMENLARGMAYIITTGSPLSVSGYLPDSFRYFATGSIFGIPILFVIFMIISTITFIFLKYSKICRNIYYVGSNENAAKLSGINVDKVKIGVYVTIALISTLAGLLSLARFNVATPELSKGAETTAISAAVIGGTSMTGGSGGVLGTIMGIFLLKIVNSALVMMNVSVYWQEFVQGAILVLAVTIDYLSHRKSGKPSFIMRFFGLDKLAAIKSNGKTNS
ncbi:ABC transporter permease [Acetivibrio saccincola]|uniref:ABC transporter permease n=1 Tax=Acetivibrio saccincola TaxID=1677857 RepID=A0A2S8R800_9FIRM|nr:ABC transporter permease [Acetivibrio saccincola]PQQ65939.1 ABC transporter permease [Acetivibrio saccincola]